MKRLLAAMLCAVGLVSAACANPLEGGAEGGPGGEIVIGSSSVGENQLLAEIYAGALRNAGADNVTVQQPVGSREVVVRALQDKSLSLVPDYTGNLLQYFDQTSEATTPADVYAELKRKLPPEFEVLDKAPAQDTDVLVVTKRTAARYGIRSIADLAPHCGDFRFGGPGEWKDRWHDKIKKLYGCEFAGYKETDVGGPVTVAALRDGQVQVANLFSTSSLIESNGFVQLEDPKNMYPAQNIVPLMAKGTLSEREQDALNAVSAALTTDELTALNDEFTVEKRNPREIADEFLRNHGLG